MKNAVHTIVLAVYIQGSNPFLGDCWDISTRKDPAYAGMSCRIECYER